MKSIMALCIMIFMILIQAGCAPPTTPSPSSAGHVSYSMSAALDGKPLPVLVGTTGASCDDGYGDLTLTFAAMADPDPQMIDEEIGLGLEINFLDGSQITIGKPMDVADNQNIRLTARPTSFLDPTVLKPLNMTSGTLTISALQEREISGSASLTFSDPDDVNAVVRDSLTYEVTFSNLAVIHNCSNG